MRLRYIKTLEGDGEALKYYHTFFFYLWKKFLEIGLWNLLLPFSSHYQIKTRYYIGCCFDLLE